MMHRLFPVSLVLLAMLQAACNSSAPPRSEAYSGPVEQAVSRQAETSEIRQRAKVHAELGRLYMEQGNYAVALEEARKALEADSAYAPAHNLNAVVHMALRKNDQADASFRSALNLAPNDPEINNDYGWFLCQSDKPQEAIPYFRAAIGNPLYQTPGRALTNAGLCARSAGDDRQAEEFLSRVLRLERTNLVALYHLADINYRSNRLMDARQRINDLHAQLTEPTAESAWLGLRIERKLGDRENEARYTGLLRRKYRNSAEYLKLSRGEFD